jgi:hypothetical protein
VVAARGDLHSFLVLHELVADFERDLDPGVGPALGGCVALEEGDPVPVLVHEEVVGEERHGRHHAPVPLENLHTLLVRDLLVPLVALDVVGQEHIFIRGARHEVDHAVAEHPALGRLVEGGAQGQAQLVFRALTPGARRGIVNLRDQARVGLHVLVRVLLRVMRHEDLVGFGGGVCEGVHEEGAAVHNPVLARRERLVLVGERVPDEPGGVSADLLLLFPEQEAEEAFHGVDALVDEVLVHARLRGEGAHLAPELVQVIVHGPLERARVVGPDVADRRVRMLPAVHCVVHAAEAAPVDHVAPVLAHAPHLEQVPQRQVAEHLVLKLPRQLRPQAAALLLNGRHSAALRLPLRHHHLTKSTNPPPQRKYPNDTPETPNALLFSDRIQSIDLESLTRKTLSLLCQRGPKPFHENSKPRFYRARGGETSGVIGSNVGLLLYSCIDSATCSGDRLQSTRFSLHESMKP